MKLRHAFLALGALVFSAFACSATSNAPAPPSVLSGVYEAITPGPISEIAFDDATNYELLSSTCDTSAGNTCVETGTYALNGARNALSLTSSATGETTTLPFQDFLSVTVATQALHGLSGGGLVSGDGGALTTGGSTCLTHGSGSLINAFQAGGQSMVRSAPAKGDDSPSTIGNVTARTVSAVTDMPKAVVAGAYRVHDIDVGTGLSILVQGNDFSLLFDGGSNDDAKGITSTSNGSRMLAYLFAALGPSGPAACVPDGDKWPKGDHPRVRIDHLFLSHPHDDHVAMLDDVVRCYDIGTVWDPGDPYPSVAYANFLKAIADTGVQAYRTAASVPANRTVTVSGTAIAIPASIPWTQFAENDQATLGAGASLKVLYADGGSYPDDANKNSTVVRVSLGSTSLLLTGDAESGARLSPDSAPGWTEAALLARHSSELHVDILQVGHHGSKTSSRLDFLKAIAPTWALIGAGPRPYSGVVLPDPEVIAALQSLNPTILNTDVHDQGACPAVDRIGLDDKSPGGCDNYVLDLQANAANPTPKSAACSTTQ
jgi:beta-lactamase superfamily II metal-dependent hydrolase